MSAGEPGVLPRVAGYELVRLLGRGGMASVYLARQVKLNRLVALKELSPPYAGDPEFTERFLRESHLAGGLSHPNIVTVYDYFEEHGMPYIAMEHVARGSLRPFVAGPSLPEVVGVLEGVLAGLAHAHAAGVVHCDLKPENVLVTAEGGVKLGDFGIARAAGVAAGGWDGVRPTGTLAYMAPEMVERGPVDHRADLWSVGVMAHEMLTGGLPGATRRPTADVAPTVDPAIARWVDALLERSPARRTQSAEEASERLEEIVLGCLGSRWRRRAKVGGRDGGHGAAPVATPPPGSGTHLRWRLAAGIAAGGASLVVLAMLPPPASSPTVDPAARHDAPPVSVHAAPVRLVTPRIVRAHSAGGAVRVEFRATARRAGRRIAVRCRPRSGSAFPIGTTRVHCVAGSAGRTIRVVVSPPATPPPEPARGGPPPAPVSPRPAAPSPDAPTQGIATS